MELVELVAGQGDLLPGTGSPSGIAVPVSVLAGIDSANSDTGTTDTSTAGNAGNAEPDTDTDTGTANVDHAKGREDPMPMSDLDRVPIELEEANALEAGVNDASTGVCDELAS